MRGLVLGATGYIGGEIARAAISAGWDVVGLRRRADAVGAIGDEPLTWMQGDITDAASLAVAMRGCDVVIHAAGYYPMGQYNVRRAVRRGASEMRAVCQAAQRSGVRRLVYTGSLATIGPPPPGANRLADERDAYLPGSTRNPYFEAKWAMEHEALHAAQHGLETVILCPTVVFGPGSAGSVDAQLFPLLAKRRLPVTVAITTNFVDVRDVALAHIRAATAGQSGERYIVGGHNLSVAAMCQTVADVLGVKGPGRALSVLTVGRVLRGVELLRLPIAATVRGLTHWQPLNSAKAWAAFDLQPRPFEVTVRDTVAWLRSVGRL